LEQAPSLVWVVISTFRTARFQVAAAMALAADPLDDAAKLPEEAAKPAKPQDGATPIHVGSTKHSKHAVDAALHWLMRHRCYEGNWSFDKYTSQGRDGSCTGKGGAHADAGAKHATPTTTCTRRFIVALRKKALSAES
jgi:hypothetical protein